MRKLPHGFTVIELLVVVSIIGFLFTIGVANYINFNRRQLVNQTALKFVEELRLAQSLANNSQKTTGCNGTLEGYSFAYSNSSHQYQIKIYCFGSYSEKIKEENFSQELTVSPASGEIKFKVLKRGIDCGGGLDHCDLTLSGFGYSRTVKIEKGGAIYVAE